MKISVNLTKSLVMNKKLVHINNYDIEVNFTKKCRITKIVEPLDRDVSMEDIRFINNCLDYSDEGMFFQYKNKEEVITGYYKLL